VLAKPRGEGRRSHRVAGRSERVEGGGGRPARITRTRHGIPEGTCPTREVTVRKAVEG